MTLIYEADNMRVLEGMGTLGTNQSMTKSHMFYRGSLRNIKN